MTKQEEKQNVANAIYKQLGGSKFSAMTGAACFTIEVDGMYGLMAKFKGSRKANFCEILLNGNDLYNVRFIKAGKEVKTVATFTDLYYDHLIETFEQTTNLYLGLSWA